MDSHVSNNRNSGWFGKLTNNQGRAWLVGTALLSAGLVGGGYLMGDGLVRMKQADRAVTVRGLAERDVTADLATWTIAYSAKAGDLQTAQAKIDNFLLVMSGLRQVDWANHKLEKLHTRVDALRRHPPHSAQIVMGAVTSASGDAAR